MSKGKKFISVLSTFRKCQMNRIIYIIFAMIMLLFMNSTGYKVSGLF
jgi:hypothetical protein